MVSVWRRSRKPCRGSCAAATPSLRRSSRWRAATIACDPSSPLRWLPVGAHKATLLIARIDRLARRVSFIAQLMDNDIPFVAADNPHATRLTLHVLAAVAEHEGHMISERTKAALAAAKARGVRLGAHGRRMTANESRALNAVRTTQAKARALALMPTIIELRGLGAVTLQAVADGLNSRGSMTSTGKAWRPGRCSGCSQSPRSGRVVIGSVLEGRPGGRLFYSDGRVAAAYRF